MWGYVQEEREWDISMINNTVSRFQILFYKVFLLLWQFLINDMCCLNCTESEATNTSRVFVLLLNGYSF